MNPSINTIPTAQLYGNYTLWNPVEETWSEPATYTAAVEAYARDPELQASLILPDGTTTAPAPMAEIIQRAHTASTLPRDLETPAATLPAETIYLLHHALSLFLCVTYGTLYLTAAGAIISGFSSGATSIAISGLILGLITAAVHASLTGYRN